VSVEGTRPPIKMDGISSSKGAPISGSSSSSGFGEKGRNEVERDILSSDLDIEAVRPVPQDKTSFEKDFRNRTIDTYSSMNPPSKTSFKQKVKKHFGPGGKLRPFRLLKQDIANIRKRYISDWVLFNQLVFASAVYVFFTNILPGITFASDLYVRTGMHWGTIEVVFSTGLCGIIFSL